MDLHTSHSLVVPQEGAQGDRVGALEVVVAEVLVPRVENCLLKQDKQCSDQKRLQ